MKLTLPMSLRYVTALTLLLTGTLTFARTPAVTVAPQYDTTHVYVEPKEVDTFVASFAATLDGHSSKQVVATVTPTPSSTSSQLVFTPAGTISVFGFRTPIPYPFGLERTGYLVTDMNQAIAAARANGAEVIVAPFPDPIGLDAVIRWPGGVTMQLYWHTKAPSYETLKTVPENRVYVSADAVDAFVKGFTGFAHGKVVSDEKSASGIEIGRPDATYRRIRITSDFGKVVVLVTDGHLPYPFGYELTGYQVESLAETLARAKAASAKVLAGPYSSGGRDAAIVQFPGGYIAELHADSGTH